MKEEPSINPSEEPDESTDVVSLLKRIQQQVIFLERKIDMLISQSQERPSGNNTPAGRTFRKRPFAKPFRSFDHPQRTGKREFGDRPKERDSGPGHFYERRPHDKSRSPSNRKKPFTFKRKDRE
jgi:hypothetical protein